MSKVRCGYQGHLKNDGKPSQHPMLRLGFSSEHQWWSGNECSAWSRALLDRHLASATSLARIHAVICRDGRT